MTQPRNEGQKNKQHEPKPSIISQDGALRSIGSGSHDSRQANTAVHLRMEGGKQTKGQDVLFFDIRQIKHTPVRLLIPVRFGFFLIPLPPSFALGAWHTSSRSWLHEQDLGKQRVGEVEEGLPQK